MNDCAVNNLPQDSALFALNAKIQRFLISVSKDLKTNWKNIEAVDSLNPQRFKLSRYLDSR